MDAAAADAYSIAPRESMGKVGMLGAHIQRAPTNTRTGTPAFGDADSVLIGAHVTQQALENMPVFENLRRELQQYFQMVQQSLAGGAAPQPLPSEAGSLMDVEQFLATLSVPSHDGLQSVHLHELLSSSTARPGTTESVIGLIRALDSAHKTAMSKCEEELVQAQRHIGQVSDDVDRTTENVQAADQSVADATAALSQLAINPGDTGAVDDAVVASAAAATALAQAGDAVGDVGHETQQAEDHIRGAQQGMAIASEPAAPTTAAESIDTWVGLMDGLVPTGGSAYSAGDFSTFFAGRTVKTVAPGSLKSTRFKEVIAVQRFLVRRTRQYEDAGGVSAEVLQHAQESAKAFRALARFLAAYSGGPGWWKSGGKFQDIIAELIAAEYRVHFAIVNGEAVLRDMDAPLHEALKWPKEFPEKVGAASREPKAASALHAAQETYNLGWGEMAT